jgi:hypothetical protein
MDGSIGGAVFAYQWIVCIKKQGLVMRLEKVGGAVSVIIPVRVRQCLLKY